MKYSWLLLLTLLFIVPQAEARLFRNAYISFELPDNWNCSLEGTEWVCISKFSQKAKEAIIILTAKEVGPTDNMQAYTAYLKTPRTLKSKKGPITSKIHHTRGRTINDHNWVDGMHLSSEAINYYTRYLATIKGKIAVLVTFSAHRNHYTKYSNDFLKSIQSLRVVASKNLLANRKQHGIRHSNETIGAPIGQALPTSFQADSIPEEDSSGSGDKKSKTIGLALLLAAVGFYLFKKMKKRS